MDVEEAFGFRWSRQVDPWKKAANTTIDEKHSTRIFFQQTYRT